MTVNQMIEGLAILCKYTVRDKGAYIEAQHDIVFFDPIVGESEISKEDLNKLEELGWHYDECWCHFT